MTAAGPNVDACFWSLMYFYGLQNPEKLTGFGGAASACQAVKTILTMHDRAANSLTIMVELALKVVAAASKSVSFSLNLKIRTSSPVCAGNCSTCKVEEISVVEPVTKAFHRRTLHWTQPLRPSFCY